MSTPKLISNIPIDPRGIAARIAENPAAAATKGFVRPMKYNYMPKGDEFVGFDPENTELLKPFPWSQEAGQDESAVMPDNIESDATGKKKSEMIPIPARKDLSMGDQFGQFVDDISFTDRIGPPTNISPQPMPGMSIKAFNFPKLFKKSAKKMGDMVTRIDHPLRNLYFKEKTPFITKKIKIDRADRRSKNQAEITARTIKNRMLKDKDTPNVYDTYADDYWNTPIKSVKEGLRGDSPKVLGENSKHGTWSLGEGSVNHEHIHQQVRKLDDIKIGAGDAFVEHINKKIPKELNEGLDAALDAYGYAKFKQPIEKISFINDILTDNKKRSNLEKYLGSAKYWSPKSFDGSYTPPANMPSKIKRAEEALKQMRVITTQAKKFWKELTKETQNITAEDIIKIMNKDK